MAECPKRTAPRLTPDDWFRGAFDALIEEGVEGVRISRIARRLGVTSGSFYWHFRDRQGFQERMLERWLELLAAVTVVAGSDGRRAKLAELPDLLLPQRLPDLDLAMRAWARRDEAVAKAVAKGDEFRIRRCESMLREAGLDAELAARRAPLILWAHIGSAGSDPVLRGQSLAELLGLLPTPRRRKAAPTQEPS